MRLSAMCSSPWLLFQFCHVVQYGFLDFISHQAAANILNTLNGTLIPGTDKPFRLNWAGLGSGRGTEGSL